jgi:hypothetical protein
VDRAVGEALEGRSTSIILAAAEPMLSIFRDVNTYICISSRRSSRAVRTTAVTRNSAMLHFPSSTASTGTK